MSSFSTNTMLPIDFHCTLHLYFYGFNLSHGQIKPNISCRGLLLRR